MLKRAFLAGTLSVLSLSAAYAAPVESGLSSKEPITLAQLNLSNELVKSKYLQDTDLQRFLRGTYSEACVRGIIAESVKLIKMNQYSHYTKKEVMAASQLLEMNRVWKLTSFEMEAMYGSGYAHAAYYCDCMVQELTPDELVDPAKGVKVIDEISASTQASCERIASEKAERYERRGPLFPKKGK